LLTFGVEFPLLAVVIVLFTCFRLIYMRHLLLQIYVELESMGAGLVVPLEELPLGDDAEAAADDNNDNNEDNHEGEEKDDEDVPIDDLTAYREYVKMLSKECTGVRDYFYSNLPMLCCFACVNHAVFLFDILGDSEGALRATWIIPATISVPFVSMFVCDAWVKMAKN
jgi:hypothetical protein